MMDLVTSDRLLLLCCFVVLLETPVSCRLTIQELMNLETSNNISELSFVVPVSVFLFLFLVLFFFSCS